MSAGVRDILLTGPWRHDEVAANGIRFHVALGTGTRGGRPLVLLLHGFPELWWAWRHQLPALDRAGYDVAAFDLRGCGATDKTPRGYDPETTAADIAGVIRGLGYRRATLVGHDWGGLAAWATAAYHPTAVAALASVAAPHPLAFPWRTYAPHLAFFQIPVLPERRIIAAEGAYVEHLLRSWAAPGSTFLGADEAAHYRDALMLWPSPHCALEYQRMFVRDQLRAAGRAYRRELERGLAVPLLSVLGDRDPLLPRAAAAGAGRYARAEHRLVILPGVGHFPHEEAPAALTGALLAWLGSR